MGTWSSPRLRRTGVSSIGQQRASVSKQQTTSSLSAEGPWAQVCSSHSDETVYSVGSRVKRAGPGSQGESAAPLRTVSHGTPFQQVCKRRCIALIVTRPEQRESFGEDSLEKAVGTAPLRHHCSDPAA